ncbi:hypothetical protein HK102_006390 [Quaeritorhiza haematococci]|nr:hypothetical protein HK102_006390 [Quaeritorhiza haematococci]
MFGYSLLRPTLNQTLFYSIYDQCKDYNIPLEGFHTESGPGVFEAAIEYSDALTLADRAHLFKTAVKQISLKHGAIASFMAKPWEGLPGCSGHIHVSLKDLVSGKNAFAPEDAGSEGKKDSLDNISVLMKQFIAGVIAGLPSIMCILAPTINSYKRLVENYWAPVNVTYGFENRTTALRIISPPSAPPSATRLEMRVSGADINPYLALAATLACGFYGIQNKLELPFGPLEGDAAGLPGASNGKRERLARDLKEAVAKMMDPESIARKVLGDEFVEHYAATRMHEVRIYERTVTSWEITRYIETV